MSEASGSGGTARLRGVLRIAGRVATVLSLVYVLWAVVHQWHAVASWTPNAKTLAVLAAACCAYGASLFLLAEVWHQLVGAVQSGRLSRTATFASYTTTQIAKYLPGNVFHLAGRHVWMAGEGVAHGHLVLLAAFELVALLCGASTVAAAGLLAWGPFDAALPVPWLNEAALAVLIPVGIAAIAAGLASALLTHPVADFARTGLIILALSVCFFVSQGLVFLSISWSANFDHGLYMLAAVPVSWIAGFVTPGAPGGLGARELVLLLLLKPAMGEADALIAIALFRGVTTLGDLLCFGAGRLLYGCQKPCITRFRA